MRETVYKCDIKDREHSGEVTTRNIDVVFDYDQNDGKSKMDSYLSPVTIEICEGCYKWMLKERRYIYAYGAMGHNTYTL